MSYQYKREPLTPDEANRLANACKTHDEKLIVWTLLDTGLRLTEFETLKKDNIGWQGHRLIIFGKGGPYGKKTKRRVVPITPRVQPILEGHFSLHDSIGINKRTIQRLVKKVANKALISKDVTPSRLKAHILCYSSSKRSLTPLFDEDTRTRPFKHNTNLFKPITRDGIK